ncbi:hypothetical protein KA977_09590 [Candidatus Dependentiae bacterium]|nr:hypothetical protein [Candidatus Dependentiae bacterium]
MFFFESDIEDAASITNISVHSWLQIIDKNGDFGYPEIGKDINIQYGHNPYFLNIKGRPAAVCFGTKQLEGISEFEYPIFFFIE